MSLIADSLKRALKDSSDFQALAPRFNLLKKKKSGRKAPDSSPFLRLFLLIVLPAGILGYLVWAGAFDERKTRLVDLPIWKTLGMTSDKPQVARVPVPRKVPVKPLPGNQVKKAAPPKPTPAQSSASLEKKALIPTPKKMRSQTEAPPLKEIVEDFRGKYADAIDGGEAKKKEIAPPKRRVLLEESRQVEPQVEPEVAEVAPPPADVKEQMKEERVSPPPPEPEPSRDTVSQPKNELKEPESKFQLSETPDPDIFKNGDYYFNTAVFYQQSRDWEKALANYAKAARMDPGNADVYNNMGLIYKELGQYDKAVEEFMRTVFLDPNYAKAYNNIGVVYYIQKNYSGAIKNYRKAIDINRTNLEALNNLAIAYKAQNQLEKAKAVLRQALALDPEHPGTNYNMAVMFEAKGNIRAALHHYRRFVELGKTTHPTLTFEVQKHIQRLNP
ncbi:hypothetical protein UR09_05545 [Candidatus Nitromaritima sp. SCGC AAA799-A02]|nr:hypothetical protein UR09_05545 [Candidatus Nitromaritima sp. SCGC AAA799-A02]KMP10952.1 hypothetical protein UZ36_06020 [Candidatus Nitromaritima sp. SCGC AAA799-C22]